PGRAALLQLQERCRSHACAGQPDGERVRQTGGLAAPLARHPGARAARDTVAQAVLLLAANPRVTEGKSSDWSGPRVWPAGGVGRRDQPRTAAARERPPGVPMSSGWSAWTIPILAALRFPWLV